MKYSSSSSGRFILYCINKSKKSSWLIVFLLYHNILLSQPVFSHKHGFYDAPFSLDIAPVSSGSSIYYTTDGSMPGPANGTLYSGPLSIDSVSIIRAVEVRNNISGKITTSTYLFTKDIINQPNNPEGYPSTWGTYTGISGTAIADYEMDPELMADPQFALSVEEALKDLPVISLVTDKKYLFSKVQDPVTGGIYIYTGPPLTNTTNGVGFGWERPVSFEYFDSKDSVTFQTDCILEIQGNHGRRAEKSPKHSFRLTFKSAVGPPKLNYPLFGRETDSVFNTIILRAGFGNTWVHWSYSEREMAQYLRDRWTKDSHFAMGHAASNGIFVHLFINGLYWGLYNPSERLDKDFAEQYLGGYAEDYDVIKDYAEVADGTISAWNVMMSMANAGLSTNQSYKAIQGKLPDGTPNPLAEPMVDPADLADYMILHFYGGNWDWDHHNWVAMRNRIDPFKGFQFFCWDGEHMIEDINSNLLGKNNNNCPSRVFQKMRENAEFRRLFADRVQEHCFNGGSLTPDPAAGRWAFRANQIDKAVLAESARWGDYRRDVHRWQTSPYVLYTKADHWLPELDYVLNSYFPARTDAFIASLRAAGLFPNTAAPQFMLNGQLTRGGRVEKGDVFTINTEAGDIWYTTDGSDPVIWQEIPVPAAGAKKYDNEIILDKSVYIRARCYSGTEWSAAEDAYFSYPENYKDLKVTEINYNPVDEGVDNSQEFEFIELKNTGSSILNMKGLRFIDGINFRFIEDFTVKPGEFVVLASGSRYFRGRYSMWPYSVFSGNLDNGGERLTLVTAEGDTIFSFFYSDGSAWPEDADGKGKSLVPIEFNPVLEPGDPSGWRNSHKSGGSPGVDDRLISDGKSTDIVTIYPNYPNPFSSVTMIKYRLAEDASVKIRVLNSLGQEVVTIDNGVREAGLHTIEWDGYDSRRVETGAGIYYFRIEVKNGNGSGSMAYKMVKIR